MAFKRNQNRTIFYNDHDLYDEYFDKKNMKGFVQYASPEYNEVTDEEKDSIRSRIHIWKLGDRFYKLASQEYGNPKYWWIIALFNQKPTESHVKPGDQILIPLDHEEVVRLYGV